MKRTYKAKAFYQQKEIAAGYEDKRFRTWRGRLAHHTESQALASMVDRYFEPNGAVLDLPCGTGRLLQVFAERGYRLIGADVSAEMVHVARRRFAGNSLFSFCQADAESLAFADDSFDYLTSFRLMCHLPHDVRRSVLGEMVRVTHRVLVINYHFDVITPLSVFNRVFRNQFSSPYPMLEWDLTSDLEGLDVELCEIRRLSWYERSSALVVLRKRQ